MYSRKLTASARERLRRQRKETQVTKARAKQRNFDYVVNPLKTARVAFETNLERVTLSLSGPSLTPFMRRLQGEVRQLLGPHEHTVFKTLGKDYPSKAGFSSFASKLPRVQHIEKNEFPSVPIGVPVHIIKSVKQAAKPFGFGACPKQRPFLTPGPSTYPLHEPPSKPKISSAFGSKRIIWPIVNVLCTPLNETKCCKCDQTPLGDYWHDSSAKLSMCRACMKKERYTLKKSTIHGIRRIHGNRELDKFVQTRHCSFYHEHNGTTAAILTVSPKYLRYKIAKESYLHLYE